MVLFKSVVGDLWGNWERKRCSSFIIIRPRRGKTSLRTDFAILKKDDRRVAGQDLMRAQFRWAVGMPLWGHLAMVFGKCGSNLLSSRIERVLFCFRDEHLVVLQGFIKKTQKTPPDELELARKRKDEIS